MPTPLLQEALEVAATDRFSAARLRQLRHLYDQGDLAERQQIQELLEVFLVLATTDEDLDAVTEIWP